MSAYEVVRIEELEKVPVEGADIDWRPIRRPLGIGAFGINAYTADRQGRHVVEEHTESALGHEEVYVVLHGRARFTLGDEEIEADPGTLVYLRDPATRRGAIALEAGTTVLAVGGKPGAAFEPSAWEWWFAASPYRDRGELQRALEIVREGLEHKPDSAALLYNVACYEALTGDRDAALDHLTRAAELEPERVRAWAADDADLESLRDESRFAAVVS